MRFSFLLMLLAIVSCKTIHTTDSAVKARTADVPSGFSDIPIANNFDSPTAIATAGRDLVFVAQQNGIIRLIKNDQEQKQTFAQLDVFHVDEKGLLGIAVDPDFDNNHYVYVYYTVAKPEAHHVLARMTEENLVMKPGSLKTIVTFPAAAANSHWHQGGALHFGPDGKLYAALGNHEDSPAKPENANSQNLSNPFGKIVRFNSDGSVPADNPFVKNKDAYSGIWVYGLRNPFSFGISTKGQMLINDVGQDAWEEINEGKPALNFGWPSAEGMSTDKNFTNPVFVYGHDLGCSIMGGVFYEPKMPSFPPSYQEKYFYMDYCKGWIKTLDPKTFASEDFVAGLNFPVALAISANGDLYHLDRNDQTKESEGNGTLGKIAYTGKKTPRITVQPDSKKVFSGESFEGKVDATDFESVQWQRDGKDLLGETQTTIVVKAVKDQDNGAKFRAIFKNQAGSTTSLEATLTVTHNRPPQPRLVSTTGRYTFGEGAMISLKGTASDPEDGDIPAEKLVWKVDFLHNTHSHPVIAEKVGDSISFPSMNDHGDIANVWYRVYLTAKDKDGDSATKSIDFFPETMLSSLDPKSATGSWGPYERDSSNGEKQQGDGKKISINKVTYEKGLGVQAQSEIVYVLDGKCQGKFIADVGIDDETNGNGSVQFKVLADGKEIYSTAVKKGFQNATPIAVSIKGVKELTLVADEGGDNNYYDHADWGAARVTECQW